MHDVGKSQIDLGILNKRGPLNDEEWEYIKKHPDRGVKLLSQTQLVSSTSLKVVRQHHEKCSGRGYPLGLKEQDIHFFAKIAAIADVFDALTTDRPYKSAMNAYPAIAMMQAEMQDDLNFQLLHELVFLLNTEHDYTELRSQACS